MKIFDKLKEILSLLSGIENICPEHQLQDDLVLDSLQMVTLLILLEENFEITLSESDMNPFDLITVSDIVSLLAKYVGGDINEKEN
ncbi:MAG: acyl carrier protein [Clostridia bacterium]|nr:acyl carrier protein [Clostridia bacterium]